MLKSVLLVINSWHSSIYYTHSTVTPMEGCTQKRRNNKCVFVCVKDENVWCSNWVCVCVNENMTQQQSAVNCIVCAPCILPQPLIIFTFFTPHIWIRRQRLMRAASAPSGCGAVIFLLRESRRKKKGGVRGERGKESERGCRCSKKPAAEKWQGLREREMKEYRYGERWGLISREKSEGGVETNRWRKGWGWRDWKLRAITEKEGDTERKQKTRAARSSFSRFAPICVFSCLLWQLKAVSHRWDLLSVKTSHENALIIESFYEREREKGGEGRVCGPSEWGRGRASVVNLSTSPGGREGKLW